MIVVKLSPLMDKRKKSLNDLSRDVGITNVNMSRIKTGKAKSIRFSTLDGICRSLDCQPGDFLFYEEPRN